MKFREVCKLVRKEATEDAGLKYSYNKEYPSQLELNLVTIMVNQQNTTHRMLKRYSDEVEDKEAFKGYRGNTPIFSRLFVEYTNAWRNQMYLCILDDEDDK